MVVHNQLFVPFHSDSLLVRLISLISLLLLFCPTCRVNPAVNVRCPAKIYGKDFCRKLRKAFGPRYLTLVALVTIWWQVECVCIVINKPSVKYVE